MTPRQARRERREADRKTKKLALKKSRLAHNRPLTNETYPEIQPRWNPELEDEFPRELQIRNNAMMDRIALKAGLPILPPALLGDAKMARDEPALLSQAKMARDEPAVRSQANALRNGFVSQNGQPPRPRAEINRANAQLSSGPRTPEGKLASSRNSTKHGLASGQLIIPGEDRATFEALLHNLLDEHHPATPTEELLVTRMAQSHWLTQRAIRFQNECFTAAAVNEKQLALYLRYQTTHERAFYKALNTLIQLKKAQRRNQTGFVSQEHPARPRAHAGFVSHATAAAHSHPQFVRQNPPAEATPSDSQLSKEAFAA